MYGYICEHCGAHLDPGEHCDCRDKHLEKLHKRKATNLTLEELLEVEECYQEKLKICY